MKKLFIVLLACFVSMQIVACDDTDGNDDDGPSTETGTGTDEGAGTEDGTGEDTGTDEDAVTDGSSQFVPDCESLVACDLEQGDPADWCDQGLTCYNVDAQCGIYACFADEASMCQDMCGPKGCDMLGDSDPQVPFCARED